MPVPSLTPAAPHPNAQALAPLVRTDSPELNELGHAEAEDDDQDEIYIVEPQSGAIYILPPGSSPSTPLTKLQYTVPELVEMSPFIFPGQLICFKEYHYS
jgi:serine/threonine-protein kinase/endoribonuclease IRE1